MYRQIPANETTNNIFSYFSPTICTTRQKTQSYRHIFMSMFQHPAPTQWSQLLPSSPSKKRARQSVTCASQWIAYLKTSHLSRKSRNIPKLNPIKTFGEKGNKKAELSILGKDRVGDPLSGFSYFDHVSLLFTNKTPMPLGMATQIRLRTMTNKSPDKLQAHLEDLTVNVSLAIKFSHL